MCDEYTDSLSANVPSPTWNESMYAGICRGGEWLWERKGQGDVDVESHMKAQCPICPVSVYIDQ